MRAARHPPSTADGRFRGIENRVVYAAGAVQGIVLVTFPAASTIFTDPDEYGLSSTEYGTLFLPQVVFAIAASLAGAWLGRRTGLKFVFLAGMVSGLIAMALLLLSTGYTHRPADSYPLLMTATAFVGLGFGLAVPALNALTAAFHPDRVDAAVLTLNALLGVGTVLAPVFVALFVGLGFWWGLPLTSLVLLAAILAIAARLPLRVRADAPAGGPPAAVAGLPARFWVFAGFAVLYGICETVNGNWSQLDMTGNHGASTQLAALALTGFWAMVTVGRVAVAAARGIRRETPYHVLPFALAVVFLLIAMLPAGSPGLAVGAFGLAGLCCSALLPLTISFGQEEFAGAAAAVGGGIIACYQLGYGIAAFGVGPLLAAGVTLQQVYRWACVVALVMGGLSFIVRRRRADADTHQAR
jgi:MFS family permease